MHGHFRKAGAALLGAAMCVSASAAGVWRVAPGDDVQASFNAAIDAARAAGGGTVELERGTYRFRIGGQRSHDFYISNHTAIPTHRVNLPLVGVTNVTVKGNGARLRFDGCTVGVLVMDAANVRLENLSLDWTTPLIAEMTITGYEDGRTVGRIDPKVFPHTVENGKLMFEGGNWRESAACALLFDGRTGSVLDDSSDFCSVPRFEARPDGLLACAYDFRRYRAHPKVGDIIAWRVPERRGPATVIYRAKDTVYEDVAIHGCWGMGVIAQKSENFTWRGTGDAESRRSGVFAEKGSGRLATLNADATHFSNVKGLVTVENCLFERMMDDAINVHSTCLKVIAKPGPNRIRCRYMHNEAVGFGVFAAGEALRRVTASPEKRGFETRVTAVETHDAREVTLTLADDPGERLPVGCAVENADYQCAVVFRHNVVRANRARATLFTTPKSVLVEGNLFDRVMMTAILFEGDSTGWYESGGCRDVLVTNNVFRNCLTSWNSYCPALVAVQSSVTDGRYHRNLRFVGNRIETHDVPLLTARRVDGLVWKDNTVVRNDLHRNRGARLPETDVCQCTNVTLEGLAPSAPEGLVRRTLAYLGAADVAVRMDGDTVLATYTLKPKPVSRIRCAVALPPAAKWNGRFRGHGSGGKAGNLEVGAVLSAARGGYAAAYTDLGSSMTPNLARENLVDFGHRATHLMTVTAKAIVENVYGRRPSYSYFCGESTGGGQGFHEMLRYPEDYDGILSGVPAFRRLPLHVYLHKTGALAGRFSQAEKDAVDAAAIAHYADRDEPWARGRFLTETVWNETDGPAILDRAAAACPSLGDPAKRAALEQIFRGPTVNGKPVYSGLPLSGFGKSCFCHDWIFDWILHAEGGAKTTADLTDDDLARILVEYADIFDADGTDVSAFAKRGGKMICWGGTEDSVVPAPPMADWFRTVKNDAALRFYLLPGRWHNHGRGVQALVDPQRALERWVEKGEAPGALPGRFADGTTRPIQPLR